MHYHIDLDLLGSEAEAARWRGWDTGTRRLPGMLLESPTGGNWRLHDLAERTRTLHAGKVLVVPPDCAHRLYAEDDLHSSWLHVQWLRGGLPLRFTGTPLVLEDQDLAALLHAICRQPKAASLAQQLDAQTRYLQLLRRLLTALPALDQHIPERVINVLHLLHEHFHEPLARSDLAAAAGLSETRLHEVFSQAMGVAPMRYLLRLRLQHAARCLSFGNDSIAVVAEQSGFASHFYFSRAFKQHFGCSPRSYRQQQAP